MKKIAMFFAAAAIAVSASAQKTAVTGSKAGDNWYVGVNGGAATPVMGDASFKNFEGKLGVRVGKNFTTVFGVAAEGIVYKAFKKNDVDNTYLNGTKTFVNGLDVNVLGTVNLMNAFAGYKGEPRTFEMIALGGFGWRHLFGTDGKINALTNKLAIDFALNLGAAKAWQVYVEPALVYNIQSWAGSNYPSNQGLKWNLANADLQLAVGVNYKFGNSNGTHNFAIEQLRDQAEIDALNANINSLRSEANAAKAAAASKDAEIARLKKALSDCENKPVVVEKKAANLQPSVVFAQGKSVVEKSQMAQCEMIAKYMKANPDCKVKVTGYASPEGNAAFNQKLSEKRAEAVKAILVKKYKIAADRLETEGLGATDKLFDEVEFNRVALFNDTTK